MEAAFNQEKALVRAFSVIVQLRRLIVSSTSLYVYWPDVVLDPVAEPGEQDDEDPARAADDQQGGEVLEDVL